MSEIDYRAVLEDLERRLLERSGMTLEWHGG